MGKKDARVDAYIECAAEFAWPILKHLRTTVHAVCPDVTETIKWNMPFFDYKGSLCYMAAFKKHCAFGFWKERLILGKRGQMGKLSNIADLPKRPVLAGYIKKAVELNEAGIKPPARAAAKEKKKLIVPKYFLAALKKNPRAREIFEAFSYSHKKEYVDWISEAKREETREKRIETALEWLATGKSRNWKYEKR